MTTMSYEATVSLNLPLMAAADDGAVTYTVSTASHPADESDSDSDSVSLDSDFDVEVQTPVIVVNSTTTLAALRTVSRVACP